MEDKKTYYSFLIVSSILNIFLVYLLIKGLIIYINNIQIYQKNISISQEFNNLISDYQNKIEKPKYDLQKIKNRYEPTTSVSTYMEKIVFKTNEKNVQIYQNTVLKSSDKEIVLQLVLYGTFDGISTVINEIENELPLTEITSSEIEVSGDFIKDKLILRIVLQ